MNRAIPAVLLALASTMVASGPVRTQAQQCTQDCPACTGPCAASSVNTATANALRAALADELRAKTYYTNVMARFGPLAPFVSVAAAEQRHADAIVALMRRHGVPVPTTPPSDVPPVPATFALACGVAAQAERNNIAMYDAFLRVVTAPDIRNVFQNLRAVSLNNHLPAFEYWANR